MKVNKVSNKKTHKKSNIRLPNQLSLNHRLKRFGFKSRPL